ncbi:hypothetical protein [Anthocerotibacter panamensis]|uniref:hypothetical protein n=1 Tax=Anthocerotibacter panamensis TaxID=2857077 RepID=UPI001C4089CD|nr:hypothetical protein [Anthocerotibacter panamensis]
MTIVTCEAPAVPRPRYSVIPLDAGVTALKASPRVALIAQIDGVGRVKVKGEDDQKYILYLGFLTSIEAQRMQDWLGARQVGKYDRGTDSGCNKPRFVERPELYADPCVAFELKIHRPPAALIDRVISADLARVQVEADTAAAIEAKAKADEAVRFAADVALAHWELGI